MNENYRQLTDRIRNFRERLSTTKPRPGKYSNTTILIELISGIGIGSFLGYILDSSIGTLPLFLFVFSVFGLLGSLSNMYKYLYRKER